MLVPLHLLTNSLLHFFSNQLFYFHLIIYLMITQFKEIHILRFIRSLNFILSERTLTHWTSHSILSSKHFYKLRD